MKRLSVCVSIMMLTLSATSQDSTCLPNSQLRKAIEEIEKGRAAQAEVELLRENEAAWMELLTQRDSIISILRSRDATRGAIEDGYVQRLSIAEQQHQLTKDWASELGVKLRKARRRTVLAVVGGIVATGLTVLVLK